MFCEKFLEKFQCSIPKSLLRIAIVCQDGITILARCQPGLLAEHAVKVIVIGKSNLLPNLRIGQARIPKQPHRSLNTQSGDLLMDTAAVGLPGKIIQPRAAYGKCLTESLACQLFVQVRSQIAA